MLRLNVCVLFVFVWLAGSPYIHRYLCAKCAQCNPMYRTMNRTLFVLNVTFRVIDTQLIVFRLCLLEHLKLFGNNCDYMSGVRRQRMSYDFAIDNSRFCCWLDLLCMRMRWSRASIKYNFVILVLNKWPPTINVMLLLACGMSCQMFLLSLFVYYVNVKWLIIHIVCIFCHFNCAPAEQTSWCWVWVAWSANMSSPDL